MTECRFLCVYRDRSGKCRQDKGECLEDDCPEWTDCNCCKRANDCDI